MVSQLIPKIWADHIIRSMWQQSITGGMVWEDWLRQHKQRMETDPEYARTYALHAAEDEAWSYWEALYDNQIEEEEDW